MHFPTVTRSIYNKNPLEKVVVQLRFPPILRIDTEVPAQFQDMIRNRFPIFEEKREIINEINIDMSNPFHQSGMAQVANQSTKRTFLFKTEDSRWVISLSSSFISLGTQKYVRWEEFYELFQYALNSFVGLYQPAFFSRIGLRYINIFCRSTLKLDNVEWGELIKPHYNGMLSAVNNRELLSFQNTSEISLDQADCSVKSLSTFASKKDSGEQCLVIDNDYAKNSKTVVAEAGNVLHFLNRESSNFLRWVIEDKLHFAMGPQDA